MGFGTLQRQCRRLHWTLDSEDESAILVLSSPTLYLAAEAYSADQSFPKKYSGVLASFHDAGGQIHFPSAVSSYNIIPAAFCAERMHSGANSSRSSPYYFRLKSPACGT